MPEHQMYNPKGIAKPILAREVVERACSTSPYSAAISPFRLQPIRDSSSYVLHTPSLSLIGFARNSEISRRKRDVEQALSRKREQHTPQERREQHIQTGRYLKDVIFAANDGIITTFAVVAATVGGSLSPSVILILGFANLFADGFSMATGNYLGTRSEKDFYKKEEIIEREEIAHIPEDERLEVRKILEAKGYQGDALDELTALIISNEQFWIDFMMYEELGLSNPKEESPITNAAVTFFAFIVGGIVPLLPYVLFGSNASFLAAAVFTGVALFVVGAGRRFFSCTSWILLGLEMLVVGGIAAGIAYGMGFALQSIAAT